MSDCKEAITIPDGCYATIEGNKVVFRKWAYPIPRDLEIAALHWRMNNCPSSPDTIGAFVSGANWQIEQFEKERLKHCDELTVEQAQIESDFVVQHLKKCNRTPTFIDAIEYGRESIRERLTKLKELADKMYYAAQYLTTDASKLRKAMRDYRHYVIYGLKENRYDKRNSNEDTERIAW